MPLIKHFRINIKQVCPFCLKADRAFRCNLPAGRIYTAIPNGLLNTAKKILKRPGTVLPSYFFHAFGK